MKKDLERKEALLKLNKEIYEQDKKMIDDYINLAKQDANIQKREVTKKTMEREKREDQLAELKRQQIILKKKIAEGKEDYRTLLEYKKFMLELDPDLCKVLNKRKKDIV